MTATHRITVVEASPSPGCVSLMNRGSALFCLPPLQFHIHSHGAFQAEKREARFSRKFDVDALAIAAGAVAATPQLRIAAASATLKARKGAAREPGGRSARCELSEIVPNRTGASMSRGILATATAADLCASTGSPFAERRSHGNGLGRRHRRRGRRAGRAVVGGIGGAADGNAMTSPRYYCHRRRNHYGHRPERLLRRNEEGSSPNPEGVAETVGAPCD